MHNVSAYCVWLILKTNLSHVTERNYETKITMQHRTSQMKYAHCWQQLGFVRCSHTLIYFSMLIDSKSTSSPLSTKPRLRLLIVKRLLVSSLSIVSKSMSCQLSMKLNSIFFMLNFFFHSKVGLRNSKLTNHDKIVRV